MDPFLMIVPPGWVEIPNAADLVYAYGEDGLLDVIRRQEWGTVDGLIEAAGHLPPGKTVSEARLIGAGADPASRVRLWCTYIDLPTTPV